MSAPRRFGEVDVEGLLGLLRAPSKNAVDEFFCGCFESACTHAPEAAAARKGMQHFGLGAREADKLEQAAARLIADAMSCERQVCMPRGVAWASCPPGSGAPQAVATLLPDDFRADLRGLVVKVLQVASTATRPRARRNALLTPSPPLRSIGTRSGVPRASRARASRRSPGWSAPAGRRAPTSRRPCPTCGDSPLPRAQAYRKPAEGGAQPAVLLGLHFGVGGAAGVGAAGAAGGQAGDGRSAHIEMSREQLSAMIDSLGKVKDQLAHVAGTAPS